MPRHKHNTTITCEYCGKHSTYYSAPSIPPRKFCSPACRNKARILPDKKCPICGKMFHPTSWGAKGRKQTCSQSCGTKLYLQNNPSPNRIWTESQENFLKQHYPNHGAEYCAEQLGYTASAVQCKASKLGIHLTDQAYYDLVHQSAREYMTANNPMFDPRIVSKVQEYYTSHPDQRQAAIVKTLKAKREYFLETATEPQCKLWQAMEDAGLDFEKEHVVKPGFCVDCAFPAQRIIVELFGCYWHGHHCRFPNPDERQLEQQEHDTDRRAKLTRRGWTIIRIWECEFEQNAQGCIDTILDKLP